VCSLLNSANKYEEKGSIAEEGPKKEEEEDGNEKLHEVLEERPPFPFCNSVSAADLRSE